MNNALKRFITLGAQKQHGECFAVSQNVQRDFYAFDFKLSKFNLLVVKSLIFMLILFRYRRNSHLPCWWY